MCVRHSLDLVSLSKNNEIRCQAKRICESGCACHGITDFVTNMLMKVQLVAVSENSVHDSCVPFTVIWTWNFLHSLGKRDGIYSMD